MGEKNLKPLYEIFDKTPIEIYTIAEEDLWTLEDLKDNKMDIGRTIKPTIIEK